MGFSQFYGTEQNGMTINISLSRGIIKMSSAFQKLISNRSGVKLNGDKQLFVTPGGTIYLVLTLVAGFRNLIFKIQHRL